MAQDYSLGREGVKAWLENNVKISRRRRTARGRVRRMSAKGREVGRLRRYNRRC